MKSVITLVLLSMIFGLTLSTQANADVSGTVCVINGDLISVNGIRYGNDCKDGTNVRLHGIDAPELEQNCLRADGAIFKCGLYAASFLLEYIHNRPVKCHGNTQDINGNWLMRCYIEEKNINEHMVSEGWALAYEMLSRRYQPFEAIAKKNKKGIWAFHFTNPWEWRKGKRMPGMEE